ncbi:MAG TPA: preprotein translocase subunit SecG [Aggregatilineales bacterium]|jgi:preprotein translocase subunit SecG|nr:preprotein translocase subunit SecG [Aggregatilineales bacterium]
MEFAFQLATIILSVLMVILILLQVKGGGLGTIFGGDAGTGLTRTRRGLEKLLFQITLIVATVFLAICIFAVVTYSA